MNPILLQRCFKEGCINKCIFWKHGIICSRTKSTKHHLKLRFFLNVRAYSVTWRNNSPNFDILLMQLLINFWMWILTPQTSVCLWVCFCVFLITQERKNMAPCCFCEDNQCPAVQFVSKQHNSTMFWAKISTAAFLSGDYNTANTSSMFRLFFFFI